MILCCKGDGVRDATHQAIRRERFGVGNINESVLGESRPGAAIDPPIYIVREYISQRVRGKRNWKRRSCVTFENITEGITVTRVKVERRGRA